MSLGRFAAVTSGDVLKNCTVVMNSQLATNRMHTRVKHAGTKSIPFVKRFPIYDLPAIGASVCIVECCIQNKSTDRCSTFNTVLCQGYPEFSQPRLPIWTSRNGVGVMQTRHVYASTI